MKEPQPLFHDFSLPSARKGGGDEESTSPPPSLYITARQPPREPHSSVLFVLPAAAVRPGRRRVRVRVRVTGESP